MLRQCLRDFSAAFYDAIVLRENLAAAKQDSSYSRTRRDSGWNSESSLPDNVADCSVCQRSISE
ncbi:MAG: hypothetical protein DME61_00300 [Verrucomicrobia bacterium]|nr:MAG: hypothetical protein DME61_00300 [Verrucomicrobiota bacterium]